MLSKDPPLSGDGDATFYRYDGFGRRTWEIGPQGSNGTRIATRTTYQKQIAVNTYDEYGYPGATNTGRFQYTGQAWLAELGLYYYKARMYSPGMGRFLHTDPIGYGDGLNWYNYVGGDPVNKRDPYGLYGAGEFRVVVPHIPQGATYNPQTGNWDVPPSSDKVRTHSPSNTI